MVNSIEPLLVGGGQEQGLRSGTVPLALCAGMAAAALVLAQNMNVEIAQMKRLRHRLWEGLNSIGPFFTNSYTEHGLCNNLNGGFRGVPALILMRRTPGVHFSIGSACTSGSGTSHVLKAIGLPRDRIESSIRLSLGWSTTEEDIDDAIQAFRQTLESLSGR